MAWVTDSQSILQQLNSITADDLAQDAEARKRATDLSRRLTASLEPPVNRATDLMFAPYTTIAARIAIDLDLFSILSKAQNPLSSARLAEISQGEELLIFRLLRLLAATGFLVETSEDLWQANETTKAITQAPITAGHRMIYDLVTTAGYSAPKFIREAGHAPCEPRDGLAQYRFQTKLTTFDYLASLPSTFADFNNFMGSTMGERPYWYDWYPVKERLLDGFDPSQPLLVDIGGGKGHDLQAFNRNFPNRGRLILQEVPQLIGAIEPGQLDASIELTVHDFFTPQMVKGARAYFLHHILHDWSEKYALDILAQLKCAMRPGYSKLLIHDLVLPDSKATAYQCIWDMNMMCFNAAIERSRKQWTDLLNKAGYQIVKFWVDDEDADGIVEAIVRE